MVDTLIFPCADEVDFILQSATARKHKNDSAWFECTRIAQNMRLRLIVIQETIEGFDTVQLLVTPKEYRPENVFDFLAGRNH